MDQHPTSPSTPIVEKPVDRAIDGRNLFIRRTYSDEDRQAVMALRQAVYVEEQGRLTSSDQMKDTFDRYNAHSTYFIAYCSSAPIGAIKVINDSSMGLPCETIVNLAPWRTEETHLVEFGHLITLPSYRSQGVGMAMMREALIFSVRELKPTHILGDFFVDTKGGGQLHEFYRNLGFVALSPPYQDQRFVNSPFSLVAIMAIADGLNLWRTCRGPQKKVLDFFFSDWHIYSA